MSRGDEVLVEGRLPGTFLRWDERPGLAWVRVAGCRLRLPECLIESPDSDSAEHTQAQEERNLG